MSEKTKKLESWFEGLEQCGLPLTEEEKQEISEKIIDTAEYEAYCLDGTGTSLVDEFFDMIGETVGFACFKAGCAFNNLKSAFQDWLEIHEPWWWIN